MKRWISKLAALSCCLALAAPLAAKKKGDDKSDKEDKSLPLVATREIPIQVSEGTWLALDVAPDGKTIIFELLGDLYTMPFEGGAAKRLTSGLAFDSQPRFSPDGKRIAFLSDRDGAENLWIMKADGKDPKKLSESKDAEFASPAWMPNGNEVVVSRSSWGLRTYEIWLFDIRGGSGVKVTKAKGEGDPPHKERHNALGAEPSPDGRYLYYSRRTGGFEYNAKFPMWQVARRDLVTGDEDILTQEYGSAFRPLLTPDGDQLIYATRHDAKTGLRIRELATGADRWLAFPIVRDDQESCFTRDLLPNAAVTPNGKELLIGIGGKITAIDLAAGSRREIAFTADATQKIGPDLSAPWRVETGPVVARIIQDPKPSPDGKRLTFSALGQVYVMDLPAGKPRRLTTSSLHEFQPTWSPDGAQIAYVTWAAGDGGHIWSVPSGGGEPKRLTEHAAYWASPTYSPDGARIVALRGSAREHDLAEFDEGNVPGMDVVYLPAGGGAATLIVARRGIGSPHFGPEPDRIYFYSGDGLLSTKWDGTDRHVHVTVKGPGLYYAEEAVAANDMRVAPDGRMALAHVRNQLYLTAFPRIGQEPIEIDVDGAALPIAKVTDVGADFFGFADQGKTIYWAIGSTVYRRPLASVSFEEPKDDDEKSDDKNGDKKKPAKPRLETKAEAIAVRIEAPRAMPAGTIVLRGATAITMKGDEIVTDADVVVTGGRIVAIGARGKVAVPAAAKIVDVAGSTILPGFIDTHAHWTEIRRGILDFENWSFLANLAYGVTSGLDVQTMTSDMFAYQDLVDTGQILGPRPFSTGPGIFSDNGFASLEETEGVVARYRDHYRNHNLKSYIIGNRERRQWMVQACKKLGMMPTTEGGLDLKLDLTHALDGFYGNEHALPIVPLGEDVVQLFAKSKISYTPTLLVSYGGPFGENWYYSKENPHDDAKLRRFMPHEFIDNRTRRGQWFADDEYNFDELATDAARIQRAGGRVGVGAHGQLQGLGYHWEMWALGRGMTPKEVLRAATIDGARILGAAQDLGSLEPGKLADLVILRANPLENLRATASLRYVMKNGELFEADTLDRVWPDPRPLPELSFRRREPKP